MEHPKCTKCKDKKDILKRKRKTVTESDLVSKNFTWPYIKRNYCLFPYFPWYIQIQVCYIEKWFIIRKVCYTEGLLNREVLSEFCQREMRGVCYCEMFVISVVRNIKSLLIIQFILTKNMQF